MKLTRQINLEPVDQFLNSTFYLELDGHDLVRLYKLSCSKEGGESYPFDNGEGSVDSNGRERFFRVIKNAMKDMDIDVSVDSLSNKLVRGTVIL